MNDDSNSDDGEEYSEGEQQLTNEQYEQLVDNVRRSLVNLDCWDDLPQYVRDNLSEFLSWVDNLDHQAPDNEKLVTDGGYEEPSWPVEGTITLAEDSFRFSVPCTTEWVTHTEEGDMVEQAANYARSEGYSPGDQVTVKFVSAPYSEGCTGFGLVEGDDEEKQLVTDGGVDARSCDCCQDRVPDQRPVCVKGREEPMVTCGLCYKHLNKADRIDHERDQRVYEYGRNSPRRAMTDGGVDAADQDTDDDRTSPTNTSLADALACIATHGHTERAEEIREFEGLSKEEVCGL